MVPPIISLTSRRAAALLAVTLACIAPASALAEVEYLRDIKPLLIEKCSGCHGAVKQEGGLRLDAAALVRSGGDSGPAARPAAVEESLLWERVTAAPEERMPPEGEGEALTAEQLELLREWISRGMPAPEDEPVLASPREHWAFQPIRRPEVDASSPLHPIDQLMAPLRSERGVAPLPRADAATLLRRLKLDLTGLAPTPEELESFLADDSPEAYAQWVERFLDSPAYSERWARHWMDIWRYSDWDGYKEQLRGSQRHVWRWRDWIIESLAADRGYDQMLVEMLAADEAAPGDVSALRATGYLARSFHVSNRDIWLDATVEHSARAFLGLTINCARCHDHKYDPISQQEYYAWRAIFEPHQVRVDRLPGEGKLQAAGLARAYDANLTAATYLYVGGNEKQPDKEHPLDPDVVKILGVPFEVQPVDLPVSAWAPELHEQCEQADLAAEEKLLAQARAAVKRQPLNFPAADDDQPAPPPLPVATTIEEDLAELNAAVAQARLESLRARWRADRLKFEQPDSLEMPASRQLAAKAERRHKLLAASYAHLVSIKTARDAAAVDGAKEPAMRARKMRQAEKDVAAAEAAMKQAVAAAAASGETYTPAAKQFPQHSTGRRLALAKWLIDERHPLTARVAVNHIWMRHFAQPLALNVDDFGLRTPQPLLLPVLDYLADELQRQDWRMKPIHRLIVTSLAYQLASSGPQSQFAESLRRDPQNETYWKAPLRRLEAEVIRDNLLLVAGLLDPTQGGPESPHSEGETSNRRSLYFQTAYEKQMLMLTMFDVASPSECYRRSPSIVPQQALALWNGPLANRCADALTQQLEQQHTAEADAAFVEAVFTRILGRLPTEQEQAACEAFLLSRTAKLESAGESDPVQAGDEAVSTAAVLAPSSRARRSLVHVLFNHNDFVTAR